ncbi:MAG: Ig domain-containing protein [Balneolaceae bacterium]|nr:Ig domain-containing protein [Balneolaceae bacterium]
MVQKAQMDVLNGWFMKGSSSGELLRRHAPVLVAWGVIMVVWPLCWGVALGQSADSTQQPSSNQGEQDANVRVGVSETIRLVEDRATTLEIPEIVDMVSSTFHLYVMSERDGLVVFRKKETGLDWLYSATGMQKRGSTLFADDRFGYIKGERNQLTVLEPTSVLGVYSSTRFNEPFTSVARTHQTLWIAFPSLGLGTLSLESPETVDSTPEITFRDATEGCQVQDVTSNGHAHLFALMSCSKQDSTTTLVHIVDPPSADKDPIIENRFTVEGTFQDLHWVQTMGLFASGTERLVSVSDEGKPFFWVQLDGQLSDVHAVGNRLVVRTKTGLLWAGSLEEGFQQVRSDVGGGNYIAEFSQQSNDGLVSRQSNDRLVSRQSNDGLVNPGLFLAQYDRLQAATLEVEQKEQVITSEGRQALDPKDQQRDPSSGTFSLHPIPSVTVPLPQSVILPISFTTSVSTQAVQLTLLSNIEAAQIRGRSFLWTPSSNDVGEHTFTVLATTTDGRVQTQEFRVNVRPFNAPPRFAPTRAMTVPAEEFFTTQFFALDPDGLDGELLDYRAQNLPKGATLDRETGVFEWTPSSEQMGLVRFQIVAKDQYGTASVQNVELNVVSVDAEAASLSQDDR